MSSSTLWKDVEVKYLQKNYEEFGPKKCSLELNRSTRACQIKALKLKLKFNRSFIWSEDKLRSIVSQNKIKSDCLKDMGVSTRAGNYDTLNKYIKLYNIDISHFDYTESNNRLANYSRKNKIPTEDILVENSTYDRRNLKKRLYEEGLKLRVCEMCGQNEMWNGTKISLILDHENGVNDDNRIENLRIVCPNCNAGLSTHCGKNQIKKEPKKYYCKCGKEIHKRSIKCIKCENISRIGQRTTDRPSLSQLLQDIEDTNYTQTGKKYNVSDNTIRKWIKQYQKE